MRLQISIRRSSDVTVVDLKGRAIEGDESKLLDRQLEELVASGVRKLLLNLADLTQIDSTGIAILTRIEMSLRRQGGDLRLLCPSGHVCEVFKALHLLEVIPNFEDETQALTSFQSLGSSVKKP